GGGRGGEELERPVGQDELLGVAGGGGDDDGAAWRAARRSGSAVGEGGNLVEGVRWPDDRRVRDRDAHALEALPEVDAVLRRIEDATRLDVAAARIILDDLGRRYAATRADRHRRRPQIADALHDDRGTGELGRREVRGRCAARPE